MTGDRAQLHARELGKGPGFFGNVMRMAPHRPAPGAEPLLICSDLEVYAIGALDLALDPSTGRVPGHHAILSRSGRSAVVRSHDARLGGC